MTRTRRRLISCTLLVALHLNLLAKDPYLWLEEIEGEKALSWVRKQNEVSQKAIEGFPFFKEIHDQTLRILQSDDRIPYFSRRGRQLYNFWQDKEHTRGIWRRTTLNEYKKDATDWEIIIDIDKLANEENENWVYKGVEVLEPTHDLAIVRLSRGGKDASAYREFDLMTKKFVKDGFQLKEAKSTLTWLDHDTMLVATDFGEGTLTNSGYPRIVKLWKRSQPLGKAKTLFEGETSDVGIWPFTLRNLKTMHALVRRSRTFYKGEYHYLDNGSLRKLNLPEDSRIADLFENQLLVRLKSKWSISDKTLPQGALISLPIDKLIAGKPEPLSVHIPGERSTITSVDATADAVIVNTMTNVASKLLRYTFNNGKWISQPAVDSLANGVLYVSNTSPEYGDFTVSFQNLLSPDTLYHVPVGNAAPRKLKQAPARFDASQLKVGQHWVKSKDGTKIPYFLVHSKSLKTNGTNPTLLYAYGGFEISMRPWYNATVGTSWLARGGAYVLANIRGGGEFGPAWHQAALRTNRNKAYEDFIAVAQDLVSRGITKPLHLGIKGGSNGGLLTGVAFTCRPDLFNAVVCQVPLLDMKRYTKLLAGHSWIAEYGDTGKTEIWEFWKKWSPYHNVYKDIRYPKTLFTTSTKDDRVHPGHARKMVARMKDQGHSVLYYENIEGGHAGAANLKQRAYTSALTYAYLLKQLQP